MLGSLAARCLSRKNQKSKLREFPGRRTTKGQNGLPMRVVGKPATRIGSPFCPFVVLLPGNSRSLLFWFFLERHLAAKLPSIELRSESVVRANPVVKVPVNGHLLVLLPALDCSYVSLEVGRNLFPGIQPIPRRAFGWRCSRERFGHSNLLKDKRLCDCNSGCKERQSTAFNGKSRK